MKGHPLKTNDKAFLKLQKELKALRGSYPTLDHLLTQGQVTRESYLEYNYPEGVPDPLGAEEEAELPRPLREDYLEL
jgi:hypothetical protein